MPIDDNPDFEAVAQAVDAIEDALNAANDVEGQWYFAGVCDRLMGEKCTDRASDPTYGPYYRKGFSTNPYA